MRLWSIHPSYLDAKGLVALWREGLLALHVLEGKTKGYKNHPQLIRFKKHKDHIHMYLEGVVDEAQQREYSFDATKISLGKKVKKIKVTKGQVDYEIEHLLRKLKIRDPERFKLLKKEKDFKIHPLFEIVDGEVEDWEKV